MSTARTHLETNVDTLYGGGTEKTADEPNDKPDDKDEKVEEDACAGSAGE